MFTKKLTFSWLFCVFGLAVTLNPGTAVAQWTAPTADQVYADADRTETCPNCNHRLPQVDVYGWRGNPHFGGEQGGCRCGKKAGLTWYNGYHHWPSPWSALLDHGRNGCRTSKSADTRYPRLRDRLDGLADFRLMPAVRCDNGHTGKYCDPYGLLGESRRGRAIADQSVIATVPVRMEPNNIWTPRVQRLDNETPLLQTRSQSLAPRQVVLPSSNRTQPPTIVAERVSGAVPLPSSRGPGPTRLR